MCGGLCVIFFRSNLVGKQTIDNLSGVESTQGRMRERGVQGLSIENNNERISIFCRLTHLNAVIILVEGGMMMMPSTKCR